MGSDYVHKKGSDKHIECASKICNQTSNCKGFSKRKSDGYIYLNSKTTGTDTDYNCYTKPEISYSTQTINWCNTNNNIRSNYKICNDISKTKNFITKHNECFGPLCDSNCDNYWNNITYKKDVKQKNDEEIGNYVMCYSGNTNNEWVGLVNGKEIKSGVGGGGSDKGNGICKGNGGTLTCAGGRTFGKGTRQVETSIRNLGQRIIINDKDNYLKSELFDQYIPYHTSIDIKNYTGEKDGAEIAWNEYWTIYNCLLLFIITNNVSWLDEVQIRAKNVLAARDKKNKFGVLSWYNQKYVKKLCWIKNDDFDKSITPSMKEIIYGNGVEIRGNRVCTKDKYIQFSGVDEQKTYGAGLYLYNITKYLEVIFSPQNSQKCAHLKPYGKQLIKTIIEEIIPGMWDKNTIFEETRLWDSQSRKFIDVAYYKIKFINNVGNVYYTTEL